MSENESSSVSPIQVQLKLENEEAHRKKVDSNIFYKYFIGSRAHYSVSLDGGGNDVSADVREMGPIQLGYQAGNLIEAWRQERETEAGHTKQQAWICDPPEALMFQINRMDAKAGGYGKHFDKFNF